ncbi:LysR family transcriptional regulator [Microbacterium aerolatum]|uniref:LysR family transcriptional regulator n=1 Tax=Microbacterium aerolatum TaxID=153731 RepID=UPI00384C7159
MANPPHADDLLVLLAVARLGKFKAAASVLGTTHTTVSRRIAELDRALGGRTFVRGSDGWELTALGSEALLIAEQMEAGLTKLSNYASDAPGLAGIVRLSSPDAFSVLYTTRAAVSVQRENPSLSIEVVSSTRRVSQHRSGVDIEIVIGQPSVRNTLYVPLTEYYLRLYATEQYLRRNGVPQSVDDLRKHTLISYIETELQVPELGRVGSALPAPHAFFQSTGIFSQREAALNHAGIALLPSFTVEPHSDLVPVLRSQVAKSRQIGAVLRIESANSPSAQAVLTAIQREVQERRDEFIR